ncbi:hypothetical protein [Carnobacterium maltaromaticum]|uniref:hypothetical protein n=1 Tax=Carnobacterium maltaromaticum TaxID=2751 RepID=UPI00191BBB98|nr:hypothetical protein [Carnobacterium maltaromaticum]
MYCFNTDRISEKTGIPTVNFGINVGLGIGFLLEEAFPLLTKGDDVILCLAYSLYSNPAHYLFAHDFYRMYAPYKLTQFTWSQHLIYTSRNIQLNMGYKQKSFHLSKSGAYVNVKGSHLPEGKYKPLVFSSHFSQTEAVRELDEFVQKCAEKKIRVRITYPSTLFFSEYKDSDYLTELDTYLRKHYEVIGKPLDYMVPRESIFNSVYHVNEVGQDDRTQRFIKEIKEEQYHV